MRIVGYRKAAVLLGFGLALSGIGPVAAQTVVGGDGRPQVEVDRSVLDRLGPQPTLPDLLLGRQPMPPPSAPVKLHRPHGKTGIALAKPGKHGGVVKKAAQAEPAAGGMPKPKTKAAKAGSKTKAAKTVASAAEPGADKKSAKSGKKLASSFEVPPKPTTPKATSIANADMPQPQSAPQTPPPVPAKPPTSSAATPNADSGKTETAAETQKPAELAPPPAPAPKAETSQASNDTSTAKTAPAKAADAKPAPKPETKTAMLTPPPASTAPAEGVALTIPFAKDGATLTDDARSSLVGVAKGAMADTTLQLTVLAYASGDEENASKARRLSLSRALAVRSFLIDQGVHSTRIEVRALGNKVPEGPPDRVDLVEQKH